MNFNSTLASRPPADYDPVDAKEAVGDADPALVVLIRLRFSKMHFINLVNLLEADLCKM